MTTSLRNFPSELEDALYSLAIADRAPTATDLDELARMYPEHAEDLIEIVIELAAESLSGEHDAEETEDEETSPAVARAMSRFNNRLHNVQTTKRVAANDSAPSAANIFVSFSRQQMQALANDMNANVLFVVKIRDRTIDPSTISDGFRRELANKTRAPLEAVIAHLAGPRSMQKSAFYKADQKPEVAQQQTFEEAVKSSGLSKEQQAHLLSL